MTRKKILIGHGFWGRGGAEISAMRLIDVLKDGAKIFIITRGGFDLESLNAVSNTNVSERDIEMVNLPLAKLMRKTRGGLIWDALFLRFCVHYGKHYDIRITASRVIGWGRPAFHFLSDVVWNDELVKFFGENKVSKSFLRRFLEVVGRLISGKSRYNLHENDVFVANSYWTAKHSLPFTPNPPIVIYPPVVTCFDEVPWENRVFGFVSIGRISPEKRLEDTIWILEMVRNMGFSVTLTIYGDFDNSQYSQHILNLCSSRVWIYTPGAVFGVQKTEQLPCFKFGINTCAREAFGISTAEMVNAGIIPFAFFNGAQREIIDSEDLVFKTKEEGIEKIIKVLQSEPIQRSLRDKLKEKQNTFSVELFRKKVLNIIDISL